MVTKKLSSILLTIYFGVIVTIDVTSWIIYLLLIIFLIKCRLKKDRAISKEFFTLFIFNGILDLIFVVEEYVIFRIPQFGFFSYFYEKILSYSTVAGICGVYSLCQIIVISLCGITLSFNRFYAIKYPIKYKEFWSSWRLLLLTIWPIFVVTPIFIYFYPSKINYILDPNSGRLFQNIVDINVNNTIWSITIFLHVTALIVNGILNIILIKIIKKEFKRSRSLVNNSNSENRIDLAMAKYSLIHFLCFGVIAILEIIIVLSFAFDLIEVAYNSLTLYVLAETIMVFFSPYALLILSKDIRVRFFIFLGLGKLNKLTNNSINDLTTFHKQNAQQNLSLRNVSTHTGTQHQKLNNSIILKL